MISVDKYIKVDHSFDALNIHYHNHQKMIWLAHEIDPTKDLNDWNLKLSDSERHFIKRILSFFAVADGIVNENLTSHFMKDAEFSNEAKSFYAVQCGIEKVHEEVYKNFVHSYFVNDEEKNKVFGDVIKCDAIRKKVELVNKWMHEDRPFEERLVAFAVVEGLLFSASFCAIYYMKSRNLLQQLTLSNEWISRDEALHTLFSVDFFKILQSKKPHSERMSHDMIRSIVEEGVETELTFVREAFSQNNEGITVDLMSQYVKCVADSLLQSLGCPSIYHASNPFPWMTLMALDGKTNFFERVVSEYKKIDIPDFDNIKHLL